MRLKLKRLRTNPRPALRYREAVERIEQLKNRPISGPLNPVSRTIFLTYGARTQRAVLLLHGYTNSPQQFRQLGQLFFEQGCNVLIPRMPHHGLENRLNNELRKLTGEALTAFATESCDIAIGLGEELTVMGLSAGGALAGWLGFERAEIDTTVLISPALGGANMSVRLITFLTRLMMTVPNINIWWGQRGDLSGLPHAYPRWATRGLAHIFRVGIAAQRSARRRPPQAQTIIIVNNENDDAISQPAVKHFIQNLTRRGATLTTHTFPQSDDLDHDLVDPLHEKANPALVYPILLRLGLPTLPDSESAPIN